MGLKGYITKRIIYSFILIIFVITLNFLIFLMMPGDPAQLFLNPTSKMTKEQIEQQMESLRQLWGIGDPPHIRYLRTLTSLLTWNFGKSITSGRPVQVEMANKMPYTILLIGGSTVVALIIGIVLGVGVAFKRGGIFDSTSVVGALIFNSLPVFWVGMIFIFVFYSQLHWFPMSHSYPTEWAGNWPVPFTLAGTFPNVQFSVNPEGFLRLISGYLSHLVLPGLTLTLFMFGGYLLLTRATMIEALTEDYIVTARAKGLPDTIILFKHALKNASLPIITSAALSFGFLFSGAIITETVFTYKGLGHWIWYSITNRDYNSVMPIFYVIALCVIIANFLADLLYGVIDPRIKYG